MKSRKEIGRKSKKVTVCIQNYLVQNCQKFPFFLVANEVHAAQVFFLRKNIFNFFFSCVILFNMSSIVVRCYLPAKNVSFVIVLNVEKFP